MEVKKDGEALLSNFEVLSLLRDIQAGRNQQQKPNSSQQNLGTITYETIKYLEQTPCALQTPHSVTAFMEAIKEFPLDKVEKLQLLNNRPTAMVEYVLMIDDLEDRIKDDKLQMLMNTVATTLPGPSPATPPEEEEEEEEMEEREEANEEEVGEEEENRYGPI